MMRSITIRVANVWFVFPVALSILSVYPAHADAVDDYVARQMKIQHIPGVSLAVIRAGRVVKAEGYGLADLEHRVPATPGTIYQLASMTKQFTAAGIMLLVQDGKLDLADPVSRYLDGAPESWKGITIRQLLSHTSGLPSDGVLPTAKTERADYTRAEALKSAEAQPLRSPPGTKYAYSNLGFDLLGLVIEKITGEPYGTFLYQRIFHPLGMDSTRVNDLFGVIPGRACGYSWSDGAFRTADYPSPTRFSASGSIVSTVLDLAKWENALVAGRILTPASLEQMWAPTKLPDGKTSWYGFGWVLDKVRGHRRVWHNGHLPGFRSMFARYTEEGLTVVVLTNQGNTSSPERISTGVARIYLPELRPPAVKEATIDLPTLEGYSGRYELRSNYMLTVRVVEGVLVYELPGEIPVELRPESATVFAATDGNATLTFEMGRITAPDSVRYQDEKESRAVRIGPLIHSLIPQPDPDPELTKRIRTVLDDLVRGTVDSGRMTPGACTDFGNGLEGLDDIHTLSFIARENVTGRKMERHGGKVSQVRYYRLVTSTAAVNALVYITPEGLFTDLDLVDD